MSAVAGDLAVTVVVATYDRARRLRDCLAALAGQAVPEGLGWEVLVVDNNSRDDTHAVVHAVARTARAPIRYLFEPRQGKSHALNAGMRAARGAVLAFTDDDVLPSHEWVATAARVLDRWGADGAGGRILPCWAAPPPRWLAESPRLRDRLALMEHDRPALLALPARRGPQIWGANMLVRRSALLELGGFDPSLGPMGGKRYSAEDVDVVHRLLAAGRRVAYDPTLIVHHQIGRERMRRRYFCRVEWQAGEGEARASAPADGGPRGAPAWRYRQLVTLVGRWLALVARGHPDALEEQLDVCYAAGRLWGHARGPRAGAGAGARAPERAAAAAEPAGRSGR